MKRTKPFLLYCLFALLAGRSYSAGIVISGETIVNSSTTFTYYATPDMPPTAGYIYTWQVDPGTIIEQNTDPTAGPLYCVVQFPAVLGEGAVQIEDNHGNSDIFYIVVWGFAWQEKQVAVADQASFSRPSPVPQDKVMVRRVYWAIRQDLVHYV